MLVLFSFTCLFWVKLCDCILLAILYRHESLGYSDRYTIRLVSRKPNTAASSAAAGATEFSREFSTSRYGVRAHLSGAARWPEYLDRKEYKRFNIKLFRVN